MIPGCHNRQPLAGQWFRAGYKRGKVRLVYVPHRMSQPCNSWATGDRATPVPVLQKWDCAGCRWLPREDVLRFAQITDEAETMARLVELAA